MSETQELILADLKVGDTAYVKAISYQPIRHVIIAKVTTTQIVTNDGERFRREDGHSTKKIDRWSDRNWLHPSSPKLSAQYQRQENLRILDETEWRDLNDETLAKIVALLPGEGEEQHAES